MANTINNTIHFLCLIERSCLIFMMWDETHLLP